MDPGGDGARRGAGAALTGKDGLLAGLPLVSLGGFLGSAFLNLLRMLVVPLVVSSIISGIAAMGNTRDLGRLGVLSMLFYVLTTLIAVVIALVVSNLLTPGIINGEPAGQVLALHADASAVNASVQTQAGRSLGDILLGMIPVNIVEAAAGGKLVGLLLFSVMFGVFITQLEPPLRETMTRFWEGTFGVMMRMTGFIMTLAPLGVLGLTLKVTAEAGLDAARPLLMFGLTVVISLSIYAFGALPLLVGPAGPCEPVAVVPGHGARAAHCLLVGLVIGHPAHHARLPAAPCGCFAPYRRFRAASGHLDQPCRQRAL